MGVGVGVGQYRADQGSRHPMKKEKGVSPPGKNANWKDGTLREDV